MKAERAMTVLLICKSQRERIVLANHRQSAGAMDAYDRSLFARRPLPDLQQKIPCSMLAPDHRETLVFEGASVVSYVAAAAIALRFPCKIPC